MKIQNQTLGPWALVSLVVLFGPVAEAQVSSDLRQHLSVAFSSRHEGKESGFVFGVVKNPSSRAYPCVRLEFDLVTRFDLRDGQKSRYLGVLSVDVGDVPPHGSRDYQKPLPFPAGLWLKSVRACPTKATKVQPDRGALSSSKRAPQADGSVAAATVPSFPELRRSAVSAARAGMISFQPPRLFVDGQTLLYGGGSWKVAAAGPGRPADPLESILLNQAALEALRDWYASREDQLAHAEFWKSAISTAEQQVRDDLDAVRAARSTGTDSLDRRVASALKSSLHGYAKSRGLVVSDLPGSTQMEFTPLMTIRVDDRPDAHVLLMLAWDYDLMRLKKQDPMERMSAPPTDAHRRGAGIYAYVVVEGDERSPIGRHELKAGLNELPTPTTRR